MARIPFVTAADVPAAERPAYDAFLRARDGKMNSGPYALLLHNMNTYQLEAPGHPGEPALS
jgi:hypothetical protein